MSRIPRPIVDQIREATDIVAVVSKHVRLERKGNTWLGLCPFHQERTPSFNVIPNKAMYYCFGCQAGGDCFRFLMQLEGLSFVEAVKELAQAAGIVIPERELTPEERKALRQRAQWFDAMDEAAAFYESVLWTRPEGEVARKYLEKRGLSPEMAQKARVGFAPSGWSTLFDQLRRMGFDANLLHEVGLVRQRKEGQGYYDTFRDRLLFPIRDEKGRVIAFGGRILEGDGPKYINTPETQFYQKSQVLYGLDLARAGIQQKNRVLVVEGYFDVLSLHQAGFTEAVASCGTALTVEHLEKIRRFTENVIVLLDADAAGTRAAEKVLPLALRAGLQPWRLQLPGAKDPDELIREHGVEAMESALQQKVPLLEWTIDRRLESRGHNAVGRQKTLEELIPDIRDLPASVWSSVASRLHMPESSVVEQIRRYVPPQPPDEGADNEWQEPIPVTHSWRPQRDVVHLIWLLVHHHARVADILHRIDPTFLEDHAPVRSAIARLAAGEPVAALLPEISDAEVAKTLKAVVARAELYTEEQAAVGMCEVLERILAPRRELRLNEQLRRMEEALRTGDLPAHRAAGQEKSQLMAVKKAIKAALQKKDVVAYLAALEADVAQK